MTEVITSNAARRGGGLQRWLPGLFHKRRAALLSLPVLAWAGTASAQLPVPPSTQFDITGFLQEATLDPTCTTNAHCGGTLKVNGHVVTVPKETIVVFPANQLTWQELFDQAPAPWGIPGVTVGAVAFNGTVSAPTTGMAEADCAIAPAATGCAAPPLTTYEVHVVGNRVLPDANHATDQYIAGLVFISQQGLNSGAGFINSIDYVAGEMRVGGIIGDPTTGARVRINDPSGRFSQGTVATSPDIRFTVDPDNPTIIAGTGFPMCLPRGSAAGDPLCPQGNRPVDLLGNPITSISMPDPGTLAAGQLPDPRIQAPLEVGDYITFAGTLVKDAPVGGFAAGDGPTVGPMPAAGAAATYVSAHTITNNVAIFTFPGTNPAYVMTDVALIGTGGLTVLGAGEAVVRTRFEGMTTDPTRLIHLYGMDLDPTTGAVTDRDWGMIGVDPGPPTGAVKGRWRFRPPCTATGLPTDKACTPPPAGTFLPPTREMRAVIVDAATGQTPANTGFAGTAANNIIWGQYHAPITEYIFPENIPGTPIVENNFNTLDFLAKGGYTSTTGNPGTPGTPGTLVGVLNPWPSNILPVAACTPPVANAGGPYTVASGGTVTLAASATGSTPLTFAWADPTPNGTLSSLSIANPVYTAPAVATQTAVPLSLTVTNGCGTSTVSTSTVSTSVTINAAGAPTVNSIAPLTVTSGTPVTLTATGTDPGGLALTFSWLQTSGTPIVLVPNPFSGATVSFTVTLPVGTLTSTTLQFQVTATNSAGVSSAPQLVTVTINPPADTVSITSAEYRIGKQRLIINATSSVVSPGVVLTLQPYLTQQGTTFDPATLGNVFTNNGGGLYILTLVGAPEPMCNPGGTFATPCSAAPIVVQSNLGGVSLPTALTRIRQ